MWWLTIRRWCLLVAAVVVQRPWPGLRRYVHRLSLGLPLLVLIASSQAVNRLLMLVDDYIYPMYREVRIQEPVFVVGTPRSGTTFVHRLLALDKSFTTFSTLECLFAPSITQRALIDGMQRLDSLVGKPVSKLLNLLESSLFKRMDHLHPTSLRSAEEDYFTLLPQLACFILIAPFPEARWLHDITRLDTGVLSLREKNLLLADYHQALQRHVYWHSRKRGEGVPCTLLSKNASFAGSVNTLAVHYPDARFVVCRRDALRSIDSQFRVLNPVQRWFGLDPDDRHFRNSMITTFECYQHSLDRLANATAVTVELPMPLLARDTPAAIDRVYALLGRACPIAVRNESRRSIEGGGHKSLTNLRSPSAPSADPELALRFAAWRFAEGERL